MSTTTDPTAQDADRALKAKHRAMWAMGDYAAVVDEAIAALGPTIVEASGIQRGDRVLDVAAGTGNASIPAARTGAQVVASDLTPELLEVGRRAAEQEDLQVDWREADAEALPFGDGEFDAVLSTVGIMFAPHHQTAADETVRVTRSGGTIALINWTPEGFIGQMFATMKPYAPTPPPGVQPPPLWGSEEHVRTLLGDRVTDVVARKQRLPVTGFASPEAFRDFFKAVYGPTIAVYRSIADDAGRVAALDRELADLALRFGAGTDAMEWEYLLVTARKR